jgi:hypothetical protein
MRNVFAIFIASVLALARGEAKELILVCPSEIPAASIRDMEIQPGWQVLNPSKLKLRSASFMGGGPEEMVDLVPFQASKSERGAFELWKFDGDEVWLRCAYGAEGQITLSRKVEGKQKKCSVTYEHDAPSRIVCMDG